MPCAGYALPWFCVCKFNILIKVLHKIIYHLYVKDIFRFGFSIQIKAICYKCEFNSKSPRYFGSSLVHGFYRLEHFSVQVLLTSTVDCFSINVLFHTLKTGQSKTDSTYLIFIL